VFLRALTAVLVIAGIGLPAIGAQAAPAARPPTVAPAAAPSDEPKPAGRSARAVVPVDVAAAVRSRPTNVIVSFDPSAGIAQIRSATRKGMDRARRRTAVDRSAATFAEAKRAALRHAGSRVHVVEDYNHLPVQTVRVDTPAALRALAAAPGVSSLRLPRVHRVAATPPNLALIGQPAAVQSGYDGNGVSVGVLDTGIDYQQGGATGPFGDCTGGPATATCRVNWFSDMTNYSTIDLDVDGHGTNVAGIIAAVAPAAHLNVYRVFRPAPAGTTDCHGRPADLESPDGAILNALNLAAIQAPTYNLRAVNLSLGDCSFHTTDCSGDAYASTFLNLRALGVLPVVAAGNDALGPDLSGPFQTGVSAPACAPGALSVGAVFDRDSPSSAFSDCNPGGAAGPDAVACFSQTGDRLDLFAPGVQVEAAGLTMSGTSQATPHVAGAVAALVSANGSATAHQIVRALTSTGRLITDPRQPSIARHRLDIPAAAAAVIDADPPAEVTDAGCGESSLPANDDGSAGAVPLPFVANFFGTNYSSLYVNNNGNVTFQSPQATYTPFTFTASTPPIVAPFFADVDTRGIGSGVATYGPITFGSRPAFCVNWNGVGYYSGHTDKLNSFQLLLVDRGDAGAGDFDIVMNYNALTWETGDASGGLEGYGGVPAGAGFSAGDGDPNHFFQFPGSLETTGLLDANPRTGLVNGRRGSLQPGRYIFPVRNGAPPGSATLTGIVRDAAGSVQSGSPVQACPATGSCVVGLTGPDGRYTIVGLSSGTWTLTAQPPTGSGALPGHAGPVGVANGSTVEQDITLGQPQGAPPGTTITSHGSTGGVPIIYWGEDLVLATSACPGGSATYRISLGAQTVRSGTLAENPPGSGHYETTIAPLYPAHGDATVTITVNCPGGSSDQIEFNVYIDPSGTVENTAGAPLTGATVTLLRADTASGPFVPVPDGSAVMSPSNRSNPMTTGADGVFHWDVLAGYYQVVATRPGCHVPGSTEVTARSAVYEVPPPALGIRLVLDCGEETGSSTTTLAADPAQPVVGQAVMLTAVVAGTDPAPTGTVTFSTAGGTIPGCEDVALAAGQSTCSVTFPHAGPATTRARYSGDAGHEPSTGEIGLVVGRAAPVITWAAPAAITYPAALGSTQLNATASVAGTFAYTVHAGGEDAAGVVLHAGAGQLLDVTFTPEAPGDYTTAQAQVPITVLPGSQVITVDPVAPVAVGTPSTVVTAHGGGSGEPVSFTSSAPAVCTVGSASGAPTTTATVNIGAVGTCTLVLNQAGTSDWAAAAPVTVAFAVTAATAPIALDRRVSSNQHNASRLVSPALTTVGGNELILAFVSVDGPRNKAQKVTSVTGGGLTWTLAARANTTWGSAEVWQAYATSRVVSAKVSAKLAFTGFDGSITVAAFTGAADRVATAAVGNGLTGAPTAVLGSVQAGSLVWASGHNWSRAQTVTVPTGHSVVHQFVDTQVQDTFWTQATSATSANAVTVSTLTPNTGRWQLAAVEIRPVNPSAS
jgi:subtilisin family serine protease